MQRGAWLALKADHATLDLGSCEFKPYIGGRVYLIKKKLIYAEKKYMQENYFEATEQLSGRKTTLPRLSPRCKPLHSVLKKKITEHLFHKMAELPQMPEPCLEGLSPLFCS